MSRFSSRDLPDAAGPPNAGRAPAPSRSTAMADNALRHLTYVRYARCPAIFPACDGRDVIDARSALILHGQIPMRRTSKWSRALLAGTTAAIAAHAAACVTADDINGALSCRSTDPVGKIEVEPAEVTLAVGESASLTATLITPDGGTIMFCPPRTFWVSANSLVARSLDAGVLAVAPGTTYVSARAGGKVDSTKVIVTPARD